MTCAEIVSAALAALKDSSLTPKKKIAKAIEILETPVEEPPIEPPVDPPPPDFPLISGGDLQTELNKFASGTTVRVEGVFEIGQTVNVKVHMVGPATIRPKPGVSVADGLSLAPDITVKHLDVSGFTRHGVKVNIGSTIVGGRLHHNLKDGVGAYLEGMDGNEVFMKDCEVDHNGSEEWLGLGSAGVKMFHTRKFRMDNCNVHDNYGNGVWGDAHCGDFTVVNSNVTSNFRKGIFYEKCGESDGSFLNSTNVTYTGLLTVRGNSILNNDTEGVPTAHGGVNVIASKNAIIEDNDFGGNGHAVIVRNDPNRVADDKHGWIVENVTVRFNRLNGDDIVGCSTVGVTCESNA